MWRERERELGDEARFKGWAKSRESGVGFENLIQTEVEWNSIQM